MFLYFSKHFHIYNPILLQNQMRPLKDLLRNFTNARAAERRSSNDQHQLLMESCHKPVFLIPTCYMWLCSKAPSHSYSQAMTEGNLTSTQGTDPVQLILIFSPKSERKRESLTLPDKAAYSLSLHATTLYLYLLQGSYKPKSLQ